MRRILGLVAVLAALGCQSPPAGSIAFLNVNVLPMDSDRVLEDSTVVVVDGRITAVAPSSELASPLVEARIDGRDRYLMPGFTEMHGHLPRSGTSMEEIDWILFLFLSNGVTTVRGMLGNPYHLQLRAEIENGARLGPTLYAAGPPFRGSPDLSAERARAAVREQQAAGYDLLKILEGLSSEVYDAIADEARIVGIPFGGHVPNDVGLMHALAEGQGSIDHMDGFLAAVVPEDSPIWEADPAVRSRDLGLHADESLIPHAVEATKIAGASVVPTMALWDTFNADRETGHYASIEALKYLPRRIVDAWIDSQQRRRERSNPAAGERVLEIRKKVLAALRDSGVRIVFGTDAPQVFNVPGFSIHREMEIMAAAGLTPYEILASGTRNAAEHFRSDEFGQVAVGKRADLILLEENPLDDVARMANQAGVMVRGRWLPRAEIDARLAELAPSE